MTIRRMHPAFHLACQTWEVGFTLSSGAGPYLRGFFASRGHRWVSGSDRKARLDRSFDLSIERVAFPSVSG